MLTGVHHEGLTARSGLDANSRLWQWLWNPTATPARQVHTTSIRSFGLLIAYVLPGFTLLCGLATLSEPLRLWLLGAQPGSSTLAIGGVLYITAASVVAGMILNALRWAVIDTIHHSTGLVRPVWNDALLADRLPAFERLVEDHFRYYQFYGNTALAGIFATLAWRVSPLAAGAPPRWLELAFIVVELTLVLASRDALGRYYRRTGALLALSEKETTVTNGSHPKPDPKKPEGKTPKAPTPTDNKKSK